MFNPLDQMQKPSQEPDPAEQFLPVSQKAQKVNMSKFDQPIPGQSLTSSPGQASYEQPPQFTKLSDATDYLFDRITQPDVQRDLLRLLDAGIPVSIMIEPMIMQGVNQGVFNLDLGILAIKPLATMIAGLAQRAGVTPVMVAPKKTAPVDTTSFAAAFQKKKDMYKKMEPTEIEQRSQVSNSLLAKVQ